MPEQVCIVSAVRSPIGTLGGSLSSLRAHELGSQVISAALAQTGIEATTVSEVIMGQVYTAGQGQNPARQASMMAGVPKEVPAWGLNMLCGSGLQAIAQGYQAVKSGDSQIVIAGGQESMSRAPHAIELREKLKMGDATMVDTMLHDGLIDAFVNCHMGVTAENVAREYNITRAEQDEFALISQRKTEEAMNSGVFDAELVSITVQTKKDLRAVHLDESPHLGSTLAGLQRLAPCFVTTGAGTVTPGNAPAICDGAAAVILMNEEVAKEKNLPVLARIISWAQAGVSPHIMGVGPIPAIKKALSKAGWSIDDVDLFELNEAFAAQSIAVIRELGIDKQKSNISGGAIALGHPIGASGARVLVTLVHALKRVNKKRGLAALCIGGGMGIAMCIEAS